MKFFPKKIVMVIREISDVIFYYVCIFCKWITAHKKSNYPVSVGNVRVSGGLFHPKPQNKTPNYALFQAKLRPCWHFQRTD